MNRKFQSKIERICWLMALIWSRQTNHIASHHITAYSHEHRTLVNSESYKHYTILLVSEDPFHLQDIPNYISCFIPLHRYIGVQSTCIIIITLWRSEKNAAKITFNAKLMLACVFFLSFFLSLFLSFLRTLFPSLTRCFWLIVFFHTKMHALFSAIYNFNCILVHTNCTTLHSTAPSTWKCLHQNFRKFYVNI